MQRPDIKDLTLKELEKVLVKINHPSYRAKQVFSWLYKKNVSDFNSMKNLPLLLKEELDKKYRIGELKVSEHLKSRDVEKILFELEDSRFIETVLIYAKDRKTLCISTQVGCKFACTFCASGEKGFVRNLTPSEIVSQVLYFTRTLKHEVTNYVFMGMGEPLDNYENLEKAIIIMNDPDGLEIGARRITVSTSGLVPGIKKLKSLGIQVNLSISLHAANNKLRDMLMPINRIYPLQKLIKASEDYIGETKRKITLEYVLIKNVNDSLEDIDKLSKIAKNLNAKINVIPYSEVENQKFKPPEKGEINLFVNRLLEKKVQVTLRQSKGSDIKAACGQLAGKKIK